MPETRISCKIDQRGIARLTLTRPEVHNALDDITMSALTQEIVSVSRSPDVRVIVLTGEGEAFCAGTDITWMEHLAAEEPSADARLLGNLLLQLRNTPKPTIARVNGTAMGAGLALASTCDIAVADDETKFSLPAVRLGTVPAALAPFLLEAVSPSTLRRYALTGEIFSASEARRLGFIHATCLGAHLDETVDGFLEQLLAGGPQAQKEIKALSHAYSGETVSPALIDGAAKVSARIRRTKEAREGLSAFIEKRPPNW